MSFNPNSSKKVQEAISSRNCTKEDYLPIYFNNITVTQTTAQKHIELYLDENLNYNTHIHSFMKPFCNYIRKVYLQYYILVVKFETNKWMCKF